MQIIDKNIEDLKFYNLNAKKHPKDQVDKIVSSIKQFGFRNPVLIDKDNNLIAGHGRILAAKLLKLETVPCIQIEDMTPQQIKAYRIMDNKSAESEWDFNFLKSDFEDLMTDNFDLELTGFTPGEIDDIMGNSSEEGEEDDFDTDKAFAEPKYKVELGDVWQLGTHRLMCGDSIDERQVKVLMNDKKADMVFTDPPYNVAYDRTKSPMGPPKGSELNKSIMNDCMNAEDFNIFVKGFMKQLLSNNKGALYICMSCKEWATIMNSFEDLGGHWSSTIIWNKSSMVLSRKDYHPKFEPILYGWLEGNKHISSSNRTKTDVWEFDKPHKSDLHPTMKPIPLVVEAINNSSLKGNIVMDLFGGSGSTLIACEQTGRICHMMELDPKYVSVIIERWEALTGLKANKI